MELLNRPRANAEQVRRIKAWVTELIASNREVVVTVAELACRQSGCAPLETSIGLFIPGYTRRISIHKAALDVTREDVASALAALGKTPF